MREIIHVSLQFNVTSLVIKHEDLIAANNPSQSGPNIFNIILVCPLFLFPSRQEGRF
jgi:hypothetical protein